MNNIDPIDQILDSVWDEACDMMEDGGTADISRPKARLAIEKLIRDAYNKGWNDRNEHAPGDDYHDGNTLTKETLTKGEI
jgi:hypothetical protein